MDKKQGMKKQQDKKITIGDVAAALGVSKTTVSRAISGKGRISKETTQKVQDYIKANDYRPSLIAKGLAESKTFNIGFVLPLDYTLEELPFFYQCMMAVVEIAESMNYDVVVIQCSDKDIDNLKRIVSNHKIDGIILTRTYTKDLAVEYLLEKKISFITIGSSSYDKVIQIDYDHQGACKELTSVILMKGVRKLALIGGDENQVVNKKRLKGYLAAHEISHIPIHPENIYLNLETDSQICNVVESLIMKRIDCIICMDDYFCNGVLQKLKAERIMIPRDIMVASFYNSRLLEIILQPLHLLLLIVISWEFMHVGLYWIYWQERK